MSGYAAVLNQLDTLLGREAEVLHEGLLQIGTHVLALDGGSLADGAYVVRAVIAGAAPALARFTVLR